MSRTSVKQSYKMFIYKYKNGQTQKSGKYKNNANYNK